MTIMVCHSTVANLLERWPSVWSIECATTRTELSDDVNLANARKNEEMPVSGPIFAPG